MSSCMAMFEAKAGKMLRSTNPRKFLTPEELAQVESAIGKAERETSAEIKLAIVRHCWTSIWAKAAGVFRKLGLHKTAERNCVLILLVTTNREFLIYGDKGIHEKVGQPFWDDVRNVMAGRFAEGRFSVGLEEGIGRIGAKLARHFPHPKDDRNEIPDNVAYAE